MFKQVLTLFFLVVLFFNGAMASDLYFMPKEQDKALRALINTIKNRYIIMERNNNTIELYNGSNRANK